MIHLLDSLVRIFDESTMSGQFIVRYTKLEKNNNN